jgi:hypothetical protein
VYHDLSIFLLVSQTRLHRVKKVGSGGYGLVEVCVDNLTNELVVVKYMVRHPYTHPSRRLHHMMLLYIDHSYAPTRFRVHGLMMVH